MIRIRISRIEQNKKGAYKEGKLFDDCRAAFLFMAVLPVRGAGQYADTLCVSWDCPEGTHYFLNICFRIPPAPTTIRAPTIHFTSMFLISSMLLPRLSVIVWEA